MGWDHLLVRNCGALDTSFRLSYPMLVPYYRSLFKSYNNLGLIYFISFASNPLVGYSKQKDRERVRRAKDMGVDG
jgi:hypothetical protein